MEDFNYFEKELLDVTGGAIRLKIEGSGGGTKWLSLDEEEFDAVEALLVKLYQKRLDDERTETYAKIRKAVRERLHHAKVSRVVVEYRSLNHFEAKAFVHDGEGDIRREYFTVLIKDGEVEFQN